MRFGTWRYYTHFRPEIKYKFGKGGTFFKRLDDGQIFIPDKSIICCDNAQTKVNCF
jgi:hypothetical protein